MRSLSFSCTLIAPATAQEAPNNDAAQTIVHLLDYVGVDYPEFVKDGKVVDESEYAEQLEFSGQVIVLLDTLPENPAKARLSERAATLKSRIEAKAPGAEVSKLAGELRWDVIEAYRLAVAPKRAPDLARAEKLYAADCAVCHGARGMGDGPAARGMDPAPANFHDAARMASRSVYGLYSTISLGVTGTPMVPFKQLPESDRWALAFYVSTLGTDPDTLRKGKALSEANDRSASIPNLRDLATVDGQRSDVEVRRRRGGHVCVAEGEPLGGRRRQGIAPRLHRAPAGREPRCLSRRRRSESAATCGHRLPGGLRAGRGESRHGGP